MWIEEEVVRRAHLELLAEHGGSAGVRDGALLDSALHRARNISAYSEETPTIFQLAAAYGYGIAKNHPFVDGNKRTALAICIGFLRINGIIVRAPQIEMYKVFYGLAAGHESEASLATWLEAHAH
ncbi:MAG: type II toxin-antitoxin system death-on-curing family toxin [Acidobacteria bacterium]|nr:type II toxin-antitoxin system death-on-curing family toxin [Acidobacteriota bacterium]